MAQGTWEDFTNKYGFSDGAGLEGRDYRARDILIKLLNEQPEVKSAGIRAIAYDRPGMHNSCLILLWQDTPGKSDEDLVKEYFSDSQPEPELPSLAADLNELISQAYEEADESPDAAD